ncbi:MAG: SAM-dependent chlorinase/fluorinase [Chitinophagales bacterium]|nr:SAM-dependent chlorinase/fluorinase [Chitinophagales bacterium]MDW8427664.1 SAM-dependent chlorinase/fluorinase [Chitinophagales bacterium]
MAIVTLTTDLGNTDYYAAALHGTLLRYLRDVTIVDITHQIEPYNILQAAFVLRQAFAHFPEGTIHLALADTYGGSRKQPLIASYRSHWFVAPDNGLLALLWEADEADAVWRTDPDLLPQVQPSLMAQPCVAAVVALALGKPPNSIGSPCTDFVRLSFGLPVLSRDFLRGEVIHVDHFGNCIVNISRHDFERIGNGRPFQIKFKRYDELNQLSQDYGSVDHGRMLCFFNAAGYLEIAINHAHAAKLLNLRVRDKVEVTFRSQA